MIYLIERSSYLSEEKLPAKPNKLDEMSPEERWLEMINRHRDRIYKAAAGILAMYWDLGKDVKKLSEEPSYYGGHIVKELAAELLISESNVTKAYKFNRLFTLEDLRRLQQHQVPWSFVANCLLQMDDGNKRRELEDKFTSRELTIKDIEKIVRNETVQAQQSGTKNKKGVTLITKLRKCVNHTGELTDMLMADVPVFIDANVEGELDDKQREQYDALIDAIGKLNSVCRQLMDRM